LKYIFLALLLFVSSVYGQDSKSIKISEEKKANRIFLIAENHSEKDLDVLVTVEGTGIRQPKGKPRKVRVPAASKVTVKSLIVERGKKPQYTFDLDVSDSLSRRVIRKPATPIKIDPKKPIIIYTFDRCTSCDSIIANLDRSYYTYTVKQLSESPAVDDYMKKALVGTKTPYETLVNPIINLAGKFYTEIETYEQLMEAIKEED